MKVIGPVIFALIAAFGNALFATGQKKSLNVQNPFSFISLAALVCIVLTLLSVPLFGRANFLDVIKSNLVWAVVSGVGLFLTYIGFNLLYTRYGASQYVLYAVISILTTSVVVGVLIFKESFNSYHVLAALSAIVSIVFYSVGQARL